MTKRDSQRDSHKKFDAATIEKERLTALQTGYGQLNEEIRYFGQRLHQSYYILISTTVLMVGLGVEEIVNWRLVYVLGGIIFGMTGYMMFRFRVKQRSGAVLRRHIENNISKGKIPDIDQTLQIQKNVWVDITRWDEENDNSITHDRTNWDEFKKIRPIMSSRFLSQFVMIIGVISFGVGFLLYLCP